MGHTAEWGTFFSKQGVLAKSGRAGSALGLARLFSLSLALLGLRVFLLELRFRSHRQGNHVFFAWAVVTAFYSGGDGCF
jgi:hypothetical protein